MLYLASIRRLLQVLRVLTRHLLAVTFGSRRLPAVVPIPSGWRERAAMTEPERFHALLEELGGTFVKFGQMLALQPDILADEYCDALCDLLDRLPASPYVVIEQLFIEELGQTPDKLFQRFERRPIAAASIGQVHMAWLKGRKVAVKVQRPDAERDFGGDMLLMKLAAGAIHLFKFRRLIFLLEPLVEFMEWTVDELDYRREATFLRELAAGSRGRAYQHVPEVFADYTTRRILVMEFLDGVTVLDYLRAVDIGDEVTLQRLAFGGFDAGTFAAHIVDNFLHQAFVHGVFHADLHPANLMILPGNVVGYLDLGITGTLSPYSRRQLAKMTLAYTQGDVDNMSSAFRRVSLADAAASERYRKGLQRLAEDWYEVEPSGVRLRQSFTVVMLDMLRLSRQTDAWAQRDVIKYIRSSIATDGLITRCAPDVDLSEHLARACARHLGVLDRWSSGQPRAWVTGSSAALRRTIRCGWRSLAVLQRFSRGELPLLAALASPRIGGRQARADSGDLLEVVLPAMILCFFLGELIQISGTQLLAVQAFLLAVVLAKLRAVRSPT